MEPKNTATLSAIGLYLLLSLPAVCTYTFAYGLATDLLQLTLSQHSLLMQVLPFLAGAVLLMSLIFAMTWITQYPPCLKWAITRSITQAKEETDYLFSLLDNCVYLDHNATCQRYQQLLIFLKRPDHPFPGCRLWDKQLSHDALTTHLHAPHFIRSVSPESPTESNLLWRARQTGGRRYLRRLWRPLPLSEKKQYLQQKKDGLNDAQRATLLAQLFTLSPPNQQPALIKAYASHLHLMSGTLYLKLLSSSTIPLKYKSSYLLTLLTQALQTTQTMDLATQATVVTVDLLAALPAYLGSAPHQWLACFNTIRKIAPSLITHLIAQPTFFNALLKQHALAGRQDWQGYLDFFNQLANLADHTPSPQDACLHAPLYENIKEDESLPHEEKMCLLALLLKRRKRYYQAGAENAPQRVNTIEWIGSLPPTFTIQDYAALFQCLDDADKTALATSRILLSRLFDALSHIPRQNYNSVDCDHDAIAKSATLFLSVLQHIPPDHHTHTEHNDIDAALYHAIAASEYDDQQKQTLLCTLIKKDFTYMNAITRDDNRILTEALFAYQLSPRVVGPLLDEIEQQFKQCQETAINPSLSAHITNYRNIYRQRYHLMHVQPHYSPSPSSQYAPFTHKA